MWHGAVIAVVVPAYCEERLIGRTLAGIPGFVDTIVVVDDHSPDRTRERAESSGRPGLVCIRHAQNRGVGAAIVTGYRAALETGADVIAVMAGDDQMDPLDLARVIEPVVQGRADYVKGNRLMHPLRHAMPRARRLGTRALGLLTRIATGLEVFDTQCGYTAISARAARLLPLGELWPRYGYPNDLLGLLAAFDFDVEEVEVRPVYRDEKSGLGPRHLFSISWVIARRWYLERTRARSPRASRASGLAG